MILVLSGRAREPNKDDRRKLKRLIDYIKETAHMYLVPCLDEEVPIAKRYVDASFAVHGVFGSHAGGLLKFDNGGGAAIVVSSKQKSNARSSTEAELIGCDNVLAKILWCQKLLHGQGMYVAKSTLYQDNKSTILLENKGTSSVGKRMRRTDIGFFFVEDRADRGDLEIKFCPTKDTSADYFTKTLRGKLFLEFGNGISGQKW